MKVNLTTCHYNHYIIKLHLQKKDRNNKQKHFWGKMKCDVGMMIDRDVAEKSMKTR